MLNQIILVGRLVETPKTNETEDGKKISNITLAVPRACKNINGEYETDFIDIVLWQGIATNTSEYCKKGDIIGVKGRIQTRIIEEQKITELVAEKVTFLSTNPNLKKEEE